MTLIEHLEELRNRLLIAFGAWIAGTAVSFYFEDRLLEWLKQPLPVGMTLNAFGVLEPFIVSMQIAAFFGLVLSSPIVFGQIWGFLAPGLYPEERRWAVPFIFFTAIAFATGVLFARYVAIPFALPILLGFLGGQVNILLRIGDYITKVLAYMAIFGLIFETPVIGFLLARLGLLRAPFLRRYRRYAIVINCILAAVITPTADPFNFGLVAVPLVLLYEITIFVVRLAQQKVDSEREDPSFTQAH